MQPQTKMDVAYFLSCPAHKMEKQMEGVSNPSFSLCNRDKNITETPLNMFLAEQFIHDALKWSNKTFSLVQ